MRNQWTGGVWAVLTVSTAALGFVSSACESGGPKSKCVTQGTQYEISGNHGHAIDVPADHVKRAIGGTYPVKGGDHEHAIVLKDADMKGLGAGTPVKTRTSSVNGHVHEAEVKCKD